MFASHFENFLLKGSLKIILLHSQSYIFLIRELYEKVLLSMVMYEVETLSTRKRVDI